MICCARRLSIVPTSGRSRIAVVDADDRRRELADGGLVALRAPRGWPRCTCRSRATCRRRRASARSWKAACASAGSAKWAKSRSWRSCQVAAVGAEVPLGRAGRCARARRPRAGGPRRSQVDHAREEAEEVVSLGLLHPADGGRRRGRTSASPGAGGAARRRPRRSRRVPSRRRGGARRGGPGRPSPSSKNARRLASSCSSSLRLCSRYSPGVHGGLALLIAGLAPAGLGGVSAPPNGRSIEVDPEPAAGENVARVVLGRVQEHPPRRLRRRDPAAPRRRGDRRARRRRRRSSWSSPRRARPRWSRRANVPGARCARWRAEVDVIDAELGERLLAAARARFAQARTLPLVSGGDLFGALVLFFPDAAAADASSIADVAEALVDLAAISARQRPPVRGAQPLVRRAPRLARDARADREAPRARPDGGGHLARSQEHPEPALAPPAAPQADPEARRPGGAEEAIAEMEQVVRSAASRRSSGCATSAARRRRTRLEPVDLDALAHEAVELSPPAHRLAPAPARRSAIVEELGAPPPVMARSARGRDRARQPRRRTPSTRWTDGGTVTVQHAAPRDGGALGRACATTAPASRAELQGPDLRALLHHQGPGRARGSASRWSTPSPSATAAGSPSRRRPGGARRSPSPSPRPRPLPGDESEPRPAGSGPRRPRSRGACAPRRALCAWSRARTGAGRGCRAGRGRLPPLVRNVSGAPPVEDRSMGDLGWMSAMVLDAPRRPLRLAEVPVPSPGPGELLLARPRLRRVPHRPARGGRRARAGRSCR